MIKKTINKIITGLLVLPNLRQGNGTEVPIAVQEDGLLVKGSGSLTVNWTDVQDKPTEFPPSSHTHPFSEVTGTATAAQIPTLAISKISGLQGALDAKLTGVQGAAVADAVDETEVVAQFNALLASLRTAGIIAT